MRSLTVAFGAGILMIALAAVLGVRAYRAPSRLAHASTAACPVDAKKADFGLTLMDTAGHAVKLSDYAGKVVILDFWATWCVPCQVEIPAFIALREKYRSRGAEVLGVVVMDEFKNAAPFATAAGIPYPVLDGVDRSDVEAAFGPLMGLPTSFVVARDGRICAAHLGVPDARTPAATLQQAIQDVFEQEIQPLL